MSLAVLAGLLLYSGAAAGEPLGALEPMRSSPALTSKHCASLTAAHRRFDRLDRDGDGVLTQMDLRRRLMGRDRAGRPRQDRLARSLDRNGDGRATRSELPDVTGCSHPMSRLWQGASRGPQSPLPEPTDQ